MQTRKGTASVAKSAFLALLLGCLLLFFTLVLLAHLVFLGVLPEFWVLLVCLRVVLYFWFLVFTNILLTCFNILGCCSSLVACIVGILFGV